MRVAWEMKRSGKDVSVRQSTTNRLIYFLYNLIWWVPIVLPFTKIMDYRTGFIVLFVITLIRAVSNLYRNNALTPEQAASFPLRSP